ncbi:hypothetical protein HDU82_007687 [Entophlyctis luteolus]|nr:hypothetical protein HDU82_007687 [Entophlyctis luteolus]
MSAVASDRNAAGNGKLRFAFARLCAHVIAAPLDKAALLRTVLHAPSHAFLTRGLPPPPPDAPTAAASDSPPGNASRGGGDGGLSGDDDEESDNGGGTAETDSDADTEVGPDDPYDDDYVRSRSPPSDDVGRRKGKNACPPPPFSESELEMLNESTALLKNTDSVGYLVRSGSNDDDDPTRPPYEVSIDGESTFSAIWNIAKSEGFWSLWNGLYITWIHEMAHSLLVQPSIEQSLNDLFDIRDDTIPLMHLENPIPPLATTIASHALSGILLSPLELVKTRMMVQTSSPYHRKYRSSLRALGQIVIEEGPGSLYMSRRMLPTVLLKTLQPLFKYASPTIIERIFGLDSEMEPILYATVSLAFDLAELLVIMPIETVVRRLECQVIGRFVTAAPDSGEDDLFESGRPFEGIVRLNKIPYTGMWNCARRIVEEEGGARTSPSKSKKGDKSKRNKKKKEGFLAPLSGLYRGLKLRIYANVAIALLKAFSEE